jgi:GNAT superfamily N-acetyltransferase
MVNMSSQKASTPPPVAREELPLATSQDLRLEPATDLEYAQTTYLNAGEWRGVLSMEDYLRREDVLQATNLCKEGKITGWILTSDALQKNADGSRPILAACESIPVHAYVAVDGKLTSIQAHGIASVYTRPEHRGKGYASRMMQDLGKRLEIWQSPNGEPNQFSCLFSDIGSQFYARYGWRVFPSTHILLPPVDHETYKATKFSTSVHDLSLADLKQLSMVSYFEEALRETSRSQPQKRLVAVCPDIDHMEWHLARDQIQTEIIGKEVATVNGAVHRDTGLALIWCRVYAAKKSEWQLHILHVVTPPTLADSEIAKEAMAALLLRAQLEAHAWEMEAGVELWDPSQLVIDAAQRLRSQEQGPVEIVTRDQEHLCSLRWTSGPAEDIVWIGREKYAWC